MAHNVDANERDKNLLPSLIVVADADANDSNNILADSHSDGTPEEKSTPSKSLDTPNTRNSHAHVHDVDSDGYQEWVVDTGPFEERRSVVDDEVD